ncbi:Pentatricopeptide repeat [Vigna unguiculata]|uniref:Pentatricopeptide repeat n=1 Tax=Vigna unguiculata TaxID=3917 RepID=A0A4D6N0Q4_VIGUN|nr:Pentatricopeptide repeat [Vigna unguiculata]
MWTWILARVTRVVAGSLNCSSIHQRISNPSFSKIPKSKNGGDRHCVEEGDKYEVDVDKLESVLRLFQTSVDGSFESCLDDMDLTLHQQLMSKVIESPLVLSENLIKFFRWAWSERSLEVTTPMVESLVLVIYRNDVRKKEAYLLWVLVKEIGEKESGILNERILNDLILCFSRLVKGKAALEVFDKFEAFQCVPDADTYYITIEALCQWRAYDWACGVCEKMVDAQAMPDGKKVGAILSWLCKAKKAKEAHGVYVVAMEKEKRPPMSTISFLVGKLCGEDETIKLALEMLEDIPEEKRGCAIKPFMEVVRALCRIKEVDKAKELLVKMIKDGPCSRGRRGRWRSQRLRRRVRWQGQVNGNLLEESQESWIFFRQNSICHKILTIFQHPSGYPENARKLLHITDEANPRVKEKSKEEARCQCRRGAPVVGVSVVVCGGHRL